MCAGCYRSSSLSDRLSEQCRPDVYLCAPPWGVKTCETVTHDATAVWLRTATNRRSSLSVDSMKNRSDRRAKPGCAMPVRAHDSRTVLTANLGGGVVRVPTKSACVSDLVSSDQLIQLSSYPAILRCPAACPALPVSSTPSGSLRSPILGRHVRASPSDTSTHWPLLPLSLLPTPGTSLTYGLRRRCLAPCCSSGSSVSAC